MCLAIPGQVVEVMNEDRDLALVDVLGVRRRVDLGLLRDDRLRQIAIFRIEGFTVPEIAQDLHVSTRSIERKLQVIRETWSKELAT